MTKVRLLILGLAAAGLLAAATPIVFEDNPSGSSQLQPPRQNGLANGGGPPPSGVDGEGRLFHKKKRKKKKVICGLAGLIAGRDAGSEHRVARAVPADASGPGGGRSLPPGIGVAGFLLGTFVGSHFANTYPQYHQAGAAPPVVAQTQTQTQVQVPAPAPVRPPGEPAPVHEDYDDVEDDPSVTSGISNLCDQLQNRPEPGPLDTHFPLIHGILAGGGGGGQRPIRPPQPYGSYGSFGQKPQAGNFLYHYFKPWTDLFFK